MRTSWKKRLLVFAMLAAMLAAHAGSFAVLEVYPNHHHTGEYCVICLLTEQAVQTLHHGGPDQAVRLLLLSTAFLVLLLQPRKQQREKETLVSLNVKLTD